MQRREFLGGVSAAVLLGATGKAAWAATKHSAITSKQGVMLMNRIGPSTSELYVANADGSNERKFLADSRYEYSANVSAKGDWVTFTSERAGDGQSDVYRARIDGTGIQPLVTSPAVDDVGALSPDGTKLAFVSTRDTHLANVWLLDLRTHKFTNLTGARDMQGDPEKPDGFFRPSWSPDGKWIAFSSDRNTPWRGHDDGHGWEHTQELSIYVVRPDGSGFRKVATKPGYCLGSPKWSPDGKRIIFYEITTEDTWGARRPEGIGKVNSQIVSIDVVSGERVEHTSGAGLKLQPQFITASEIGYLRKGSDAEGIAYVGGGVTFKRGVRSPAWSPDGKLVIYEKDTFLPARPFNKPLYSWDPHWEYRQSDVFPVLSKDGWLAYTEKQLGNSSIAIMRPDGSGHKIVFNADNRGLTEWKHQAGLAGAFYPAWSPDGQWIAFGLGGWFQERAREKAMLMRVRRDGTGAEMLTDGTMHSGFPSYSPDGRYIVFRVWSDKEVGLRVMDLKDKSVRVLTTGPDNVPGWSPDGKSIVFTRKIEPNNFDIFTISPDGSNLKRLTTNGANDAHGQFTADGRIVWSSGRYGFRDEAALYDNTFQQYGQVWIMNADGSNKRVLTDSKWEDSLPLYIPAKLYPNGIQTYPPRT